MDIIVEYWDRISCSSELKRVETWSGAKEEIFKRFDKQNNSLRYCNGSHYKFEDETLHTDYINWYKSLGESDKFNMFYGKGVVD